MADHVPSTSASPTDCGDPTWARQSVSCAVIRVARVLTSERLRSAEREARPASRSCCAASVAARLSPALAHGEEFLSDRAELLHGRHVRVDHVESRRRSTRTVCRLRPPDRALPGRVQQTLGFHGVERSVHRAEVAFDTDAEQPVMQLVAVDRTRRRSDGRGCTAGASPTVNAAGRSGLRSPLTSHLWLAACTRLYESRTRFTPGSDPSLFAPATPLALPDRDPG